MQVLNTVYITDHSSKVSVRSRALEVRSSGELQARYPLHGTDALIILGRANVTTEAIGRCIEHGTRVAFLNANGTIRFTVSGPTTGNVNLRTMQHRLADDPQARLPVCRNIIAGKLQNAGRAITQWTETAAEPLCGQLVNQRTGIRDRLDALASTDDEDALRGLEGDASRRYFKAMGAHLYATASDLSMIQRTRRPPRDPTNALLSFTYGLLTTACIGALEAVGLDPQIGLLHRVRPGRPGLALDLLEEFRHSIADRFCVAALTRRQVTTEDFTRTAGDACYLSDDGRRSCWASGTSTKARRSPTLSSSRLFPADSYPASRPHCSAAISEATYRPIRLTSRADGERSRHIRHRHGYPGRGEAARPSSKDLRELRYPGPEVRLRVPPFEHHTPATDL